MTSLAALVRTQATARPDAVAITHLAEHLTYGQWWTAAQHFRHELLGDVGAEDIVAIDLPRHHHLWVAALAVGAAGGAALMLSQDDPPERRELLATLAGADRVLDDGAAIQEALRVARHESEGCAASPSKSDVPAEPPPTALSAIMFTSGTTGLPKGVLMTHASMTTNPVWQARSMGLDHTDVVALRAPVTADTSWFELALGVSVGARCVVLDRATQGAPKRLAEVLASEQVSVLVTVPTLARSYLASGTFAGLPALRHVAFVGERLTATTVAELQGQSDAVVWNFYGPTEAGIGVAEHRIGAARATEVADEDVPIGLPTEGVLWVGRANDELGIVSDQLARGYLDHPAATADGWRPAPEGQRCYWTGDRVVRDTNGLGTFVGRTDAEVKVNGVRVQPPAVESLLRSMPGVDDAAVTLRSVPTGFILVAHLAPSDAPDRRAVREWLRSRVALAAVPAIVEHHDQLPRMANGKLDRTALDEPL